MTVFKKGRLYIMMDVVFDTIIDSVKLLPFLFLTYLAMEYLEHKTSARTKKFVKDSGKAGPVIGALLELCHSVVFLQRHLTCMQVK